ncbi:MAG: imidazoleglycerol-phosphate dehydratase HisB [Candidatus Bathyarchaeia archaeon]|nr:imidazoleglycerol-phosphate dehydratase HisB [Candidatus Bathyarchaeota archaeon]
MREAKIKRKTKEVEILGRLNLDGEGKSEVETGVKFLNHILDTIVKHSMIDLTIKASGDLQHHLIEDVGVAIGSAILEALGEKKGIKRFGYAYTVMDESLARTVIDLSGRPYAKINLKVSQEKIEDMKGEDVIHFFSSLAYSSKSTLHIKVIYGVNTHHKIEAATKSFALALKDAISINEKLTGKIPSVKEAL